MASGFPEDSLQSLVEVWWTKNTARTLEKGRLIWALAPFRSSESRLQLVPESRGQDPGDHESLKLTIKPLPRTVPMRPAGLPVSSLPLGEGDGFLVTKGKYRPCLILSTMGREIPRGMMKGAATWQKTNCVIAAPYFGADADGSRGGFKPEFVEQVRRGHNPQFFFDCLPGRKIESILRLDQMFPLAMDGTSYDITEDCLSPDAIELMDQWSIWFQTGKVRKDDLLALWANQ